MARVKISLGGYVDPVRRPRWIIWTVVTLIIVVGVMIPVLGITSTRWFCSEGCHKVQDDTIESYKHSTHSQISCMACHMPVNANPIIFLFHKAEALGELVQTVTNNYDLPLNAEDEVALTMPSTQCTQCHNEDKRKITPDPGLKISHDAHTERGINCTICHNRIAHNEANFELTLRNPKTGQPNKKHPNFMEMTACFRCHTQEHTTGAPPGQCVVCHTPEQQLIPASHHDPNFFPKGHGQLGLAEEKAAPWMNAKSSAPENKMEFKVGGQVNGLDLPKVDEVNLCSTCHAKAFCTDCHGVPMPHPNKKQWDKIHGALGTKDPTVCAKCHGLNVDFCNNCHHGTTLGFALNPKLTWKQQHPAAVNQVGAATCLQGQGGGCHSPTYCAVCHANGGNLPVGGPKL